MAAPADVRTLFLDRDGVINRPVPGGYVLSWDQFEFIPGALDAIAMLSARFERIVVITNQQCVGKGQISNDQLAAIHRQMSQEIRAAGGRVDGIFVCPHLARAGCDCRKPRTGLIRQARHCFPEIDLRRALLIGDQAADMEMARTAGLPAVQLMQNGGSSSGNVSPLAIDHANDLRAWSRSH
jgi:D-glycero-D-manno-heptose 1,7-bisphosphate phosphatase